jgi:uncharacterized membrane protein
MSIVSEKKFLIEEERNTLKEIQQKTQVLITELGEIELIKIQIENRYQEAKNFLIELSTQEKEFTQSIINKYGKSNLNPETGEITPMD